MIYVANVEIFFVRLKELQESEIPFGLFPSRNAARLKAKCCESLPTN
jgi:hypothetical protein